MTEKEHSLKESKKNLDSVGRVPSLLGSIKGVRSLSGTLSVKGSGSFEVMSGHDLQVDVNAPARDRSNTAPESQVDAQRPRDRSNTAPETQQVLPSPREELATVSETHQLVQADSQEDDELKAAEAMALAIHSNPNLTPDEIRKLVGTQQSSLIHQQDHAAAKSAQSSSMLLPARLSSIFQSNSADVDVKDKKTPRSSGLRSMGESFQKRVAKGARLTDILTGGSKDRHNADEASETSIREEPAQPLSTTSTASSKEGKLRGSFRPLARTPRSPPLSPKKVVESKGMTSVANAPDDVLMPPNMHAGVNEKKFDVPSMMQSMTTSKPSPTGPIRLAGIAWKRRSGFGKFSVSSAWERRRIELQGTKLLYYRTEKEAEDVKDDLSPTQSGEEALLAPDFSEDPKDNEGVVVAKRSNWFEQAAANWTHADDPAAPRGYIDLVKEKATASVAFGHSGAPSPFAISIKVRGETKWKLCFDYHSTQMEWLAALTDVVVQTSIDEYNTILLEAADPANQSETVFFPPGSNNEPPAVAGGKRDPSQHRLWMMEPYTIRSLDNTGIEEESEDDSDSDADETIRDDDADAGQIQESSPEMSGDSALLDPISIQAAEEVTAKIWSVPQKNFIYIFGVFNTALAVAQASSTTMEGFWYVVAFANLGLFMFLVKEPDWYAIMQQIRVTAISRSSNLGNPKSKLKATAVASKGAPVKTALKSTGFVPMAGSSSVKLKNATDPPENKLNQMFAGWRAIPGDVLMVRSHGYALTKKKVSSPGELYDCAHVDIFESPSRYPDMSTRVKLPKITYDDGGLPKTWRAPDVFVMSIALPTDSPKLGRNSSDGGGYTVTIYFTMSQETRDILRRVTADGYDPSEEKSDDPQKNKVNAVRLFEEWCRRAPTDPKFMSRFKVVPNAHNLKEIGMPGWISKYNGKPFLIKRPGQTGFLFNHPELSCMEFDISLHPFPYLAKQAICFMKESYFKKILVTFGFVIEGRADDELPECLIGCVQLCYPDPRHAIQADAFFAGTCNRSF
jgi:hypothetical protein